MNLFDFPLYVSVPASEARARREAFTGQWTARRNEAMSFLLSARTHGGTWREVASSLGGHHGQISSVLSYLHQHGFVFTLREMRDECHPYVHHQFRHEFSDDQVFDTPAETKAGRRNKAQAEFVDGVIRTLGEADATLDWKIAFIAHLVVEYEKAING